MNAPADIPKVSPELVFASKMRDAKQHRSDGGTLYKWTGTHWSPIATSDLERKAFEFLASEFMARANAKLASSCGQTAVMSAPALPGRQRGDDIVAIPCSNGTLRLIRVDDGEWSATLGEADREDGLTYCLACNYEPAATAPEFVKFLSKIQPEAEMRDYLQEYLGYTLLSDCRFQRAQWWIGPGGDGKSTLASIVAALHERVAALAIDRLQDFQLMGLIGASLAYCDETPIRIDEQRLKSLISGELLQVDRKFRDPINLRATAKWIICGNQLPAISDQTTGFWRRFDVVPFAAAIPDHEQDPLVGERIVDHELAGVLNWCVTGLLRVLERGRLAPKPASVLAAVAGGKRETNSVLAWWVDGEWETGEKFGFPKTEVYSNYQDWCRSSGMSPVAMLKFWRRLGEIAPGLQEKRGSGPTRERIVNLIH